LLHVRCSIACSSSIFSVLCCKGFGC